MEAFEMSAPADIIAAIVAIGAVIKHLTPKKKGTKS